MRVASQTDARKATITGNAALRVLDDIDTLYVIKGTKVVHVDLKRDRPGKDELLGLLLGPTGNLRAPAVRKGRTLVVGFDAKTYAKVL